jgi:hypothetical protein
MQQSEPRKVATVCSNNAMKDATDRDDKPDIKITGKTPGLTNGAQDTEMT